MAAEHGLPRPGQCRAGPDHVHVGAAHHDDPALPHSTSHRHHNLPTAPPPTTTTSLNPHPAPPIPSIMDLWWPQKGHGRVFPPPQFLDRRRGGVGWGVRRRGRSSGRRGVRPAGAGRRSC
ncbi:hypothetical protein B5D80_00475 [Micromonospora wenchangensis]|uniref:Uncharacterized protein n=1 Tax=Micromonospora wenchangensis TaxID=1185415 RepID=A0A246RTS9_9ACTN|nr:hypothetical protein B5D80_00475 [Micromonospora wenchangensis]